MGPSQTGTIMSHNVQSSTVLNAPVWVSKKKRIISFLKHRNRQLGKNNEYDDDENDDDDRPQSF